jgi:outer membrane lipoprotein-sorting protein
MGIIVGFSLILCLIGLFCIFFPQYFVVHEDSGGRIRFSVIGIVMMLLRVILGLFPIRFQRVILRLVGVLIIICGISFGYSTLSNYRQLGFGGGSSRQYTEEPSEQNRKLFEQEKEEMSDEYRQVLQQAGPAYTKKVETLVKKAKQSKWYIESPEVMQLVVVDRKTLMAMPYDFTWAIYNGTSEEERARIIIEDTDPMLEQLRKHLQEVGKFEEFYGKQVAKYPELAEAISSQDGTTQQQAQSIPPLEEADKYLTTASALWKQGNKTESLEQAKAAWQIRNHHLGREHPKTKEVENMILSVQNGQ